MSHNPISNAKILLTGGAGFVGSYIVEQLLPHNPQKLLILDNLSRGSMENMARFIDDPRVEFIRGDVREKTMLRNMLQGMDYCYHLAALRINACAANQEEGFEVMIEPIFRLLEAAKEVKLKKIIYSSSASVYGMAQTFPTPESEAPYDNKTFYGAAKLLGEQLLRSYHDMHGLDYVALRYFNIYGPRMDIEGKYTEVMIKWLDCIREKRAPLIFGDGSTSLDCVYVEDVARANVQALLRPVTDRVFNVGSGTEVNLKELLDLMLRINQSYLKPEHRPENTVNPVQRRLADTRAARESLGFEAQTGLEEGLQRLSEWYFSKKGK